MQSELNAVFCDLRCFKYTYEEIIENMNKIQNRRATRRCRHILERSKRFVRTINHMICSKIEFWNTGRKNITSGKNQKVFVRDVASL
jgi:hypothetical protein